MVNLSMCYWVLVRGAGGVGKSITAWVLSQAIGGEYISIDKIVEMLAPEGCCLSPKMLASIACQKAASRAKETLALGTPVVIDWHFADPQALEAIKGELSGFQSFAFCLHAPLNTCLVRDAARERPVGEENIREIHARVSDLPYGIPVSTEGRTPDEITSEMHEQICRDIAAETLSFS